MSVAVSVGKVNGGVIPSDTNLKLKRWMLVRLTIDISKLTINIVEELCKFGVIQSAEAESRCSRSTWRGVVEGRSRIWLAQPRSKRLGRNYTSYAATREQGR